MSTWTDLALKLRYFDQAHFTNDLREMVGQPPAEYGRDVERNRRGLLP